VPAPPTRELGATEPLLAPAGAAAGSSVPSWGAFGTMDAGEHVPELQWPASVVTYRRMLTDSQVESLRVALTHPIRRMRFSVDPNGAPDSTARRVAEDLNLPLQGEAGRPQGRRRDRFSWDEHLRLALKAPFYGHRVFEQVYRIDDQQRARLRKLADRPPHTIDDWDVARDGGLNAVIQHLGAGQVRIPVDRLVVYSWEREGAGWTGQSMLRALYRHWLLKDMLIRVDAYSAERHGVGVPVVEQYLQDANPADKAAALAVASGVRAGKDAGAFMPYGFRLKLQGVEGALPDTVEKIRMHDEAMARAMLLMFLQLGQTETGSRALGEVFVDQAAMAQDAVAGWICDVASEHVVEDLVDLNEGEDAPAPRVVFERTEHPDLAGESFARAVERGIIVVDPEIEDALRARYGLAARQGPRPAPAPAQTVAAAEAPRPALRNGAARRRLTDVEIAAAADFESIDAQWQDQLDQLLTQVREARADDIDRIVAQIEEIGLDPEQLAALAAAPLAAAALREALLAMARAGAAQVRGEARAQGVRVTPELSDEDTERLERRAAATAEVLGQGLAQSARNEAIRLAGEAMDAADVAARVGDHLRDLTDAALRPGLAGAVTAAQNTGRFAGIRDVLAQVPTGRVYASELLDARTCTRCTEVDGREYDSLEEALQDYPGGGYVSCEGGPNCRGTAVVVAQAETAPSVGVARR
jgi:hypothetical protein